MKLLLSLLLLSFISVILSQTNPATLTFPVQVYDQFPQYNSNFQSECFGDRTGMIKTTLNPITRVPELISPTSTIGCINKPELFPYFFSPQQDPSLPGLNSPLSVDLVFTYNSVSQTYVYNNQKFFPINNLGFDVDPAKRIYNDGTSYQNFHFCVRMGTKFTYKGYEVFSFQGDDDVWVFINDKLVIDLGGIHGPLAKSVSVATLGLTIDESYNFDLFFCERQTSGSTIRIETNLLFVCPFHDFCGVCQGDGSSCCSPQTTCNDNNACTIDACPSANTTLNGLPISNFCTHTPSVNPNPEDICINYQCNSTTGNFDASPVPCLNRSSECLATVGCNSTTGCQYESICNGDVCNSQNQCTIDGQCVPKSAQQCGVELDGSIDLCQIYSCNSTGGVGCVKEAKCKPSSNLCQIVSCDASSGDCITTEVVDPLAGVDKCSIGTCNPTTGQFEYVPKTPEQCGVELDGSVDLCQVYSCSPCSGCVKQVKCPAHSNPCISTSCNATVGECYNTEIPGDVCDCGCGDIPNKCMKSFCTKEGVCQPIYKPEIDDGNYCTLDSCDPCTGVITHSSAPQCLSCSQCAN